MLIRHRPCITKVQNSYGLVQIFIYSAHVIMNDYITRTFLKKIPQIPWQHGNLHLFHSYMVSFQIVRASSNDHLMTSRQIEKDLLRTLPGHVCFNNKKATGVPRLRRILRGVAWLYPDVGYCQGIWNMLLIRLLDTDRVNIMNPKYFIILK